MQCMKLRFTLDTGCVIAIVRREQPGTPPEQLAALESLIELARAGTIDLQLAAAYERDFDRYRGDEGRQRQLEWLQQAPIAAEPVGGLFIIGVSRLGGPDVIASENDGDFALAVRNVLDPTFDGSKLHDASHTKLAKRTSDTDHLIAHHRSAAHAFVTLDECTILVHRDALAQLCVKVCWPTEAARRSRHRERNRVARP